ncbi:MAG: nickel/cobalt transporter [Pseudomonadota bacterium]
MRRLILALGLFALLLTFAPMSTAMAQATNGPFGPEQTKAAATETQASLSGMFSRIVAAIVLEQRKFHRKLATALEHIRDNSSMTAAWTLILTSFLYGVFHAAGPGHGKAILTTYLATHRQRMLRGIGMSAAAAILQGVVAIVLVFSLVTVAGRAARDAQQATRWAEQFSFALVAILGAYLLYRATAALWHTVARPGTSHAHAHDAATDGHVHDHSHCGHAHDHDHSHCGHAHMPTADQIDDTRDFATMAGVILSIGIRPCSGAVLVLAVALLFGIPMAGVAAVFAMSIGTAIAVATLAIVVLSARTLVSTVLNTDSRVVAIASQAVTLAGGGIILILGLTLFAGSFGPAHPLGM